MPTDSHQQRTMSSTMAVSLGRDLDMLPLLLLYFCLNIRSIQSMMGLQNMRYVLRSRSGPSSAVRPTINLHI